MINSISTKDGIETDLMQPFLIYLIQNHRRL